ncbi:MAG: hypothetical protein CMM02_18330 [Rhodopirellula sp.]|nr:hypothetical protein [Rhodopirellula sp.]|tara:strand:+ start:4822 stop:5076 length:255 start_codon:yes stop_codon:yes gene_type:complete
MVNMTDKVVLDLADDSELAEYITNKAPGDECVMEIVATLDESTDEQAVFSIRDVTVEQDSYSEEDMDEGDDDSPVMAVMMGEAE